MESVIKRSSVQNLQEITVRSSKRLNTVIHDFGSQRQLTTEPRKIEDSANLPKIGENDSMVRNQGLKMIRKVTSSRTYLHKRPSKFYVEKHLEEPIKITNEGCDNKPVQEFQQMAYMLDSINNMPGNFSNVKFIQKLIPDHVEHQKDFQKYDYASQKIQIQNPIFQQMNIKNKVPYQTGDIYLFIHAQVYLKQEKQFQYFQSILPIVTRNKLLHGYYKLNLYACKENSDPYSLLSQIRNNQQPVNLSQSYFTIRIGYYDAKNLQFSDNIERKDLISQNEYVYPNFTSIQQLKYLNDKWNQKPKQKKEFSENHESRFFHSSNNDLNSSNGNSIIISNHHNKFSENNESRLFHNNNDPNGNNNNNKIVSNRNSKFSENNESRLFHNNNDPNGSNNNSKIVSNRNSRNPSGYKQNESHQNHIHLPSLSTNNSRNNSVWSLYDNLQSPQDQIIKEQVKPPENNSSQFKNFKFCGRKMNQLKKIEDNTSDILSRSRETSGVSMTNSSGIEKQLVDMLQMESSVNPSINQYKIQIMKFPYINVKLEIYLVNNEGIIIDANKKPCFQTIEQFKFGITIVFKLNYKKIMENIQKNQSHTYMLINIILLESDQELGWLAHNFKDHKNSIKSGQFNINLLKPPFKTQIDNFSDQQILKEKISYKISSSFQ